MVADLDGSCMDLVIGLFNLDAVLGLEVADEAAGATMDLDMTADLALVP